MRMRPNAGTDTCTGTTLYAARGDQTCVVSQRMNTTNTTAARPRMSNMILAKATTRLRLPSPWLLADSEFLKRSIPSFPPERTETEAHF